jgi:Holliday junction DNA helicase RuvA
LARLATSLVVREDSLTLYGFADDDERGLFELLQTANGVGPKLAQTILGVHTPREVRRAIASSDYATLTRVPGIGRKGAEKIVIELRDRVGALDAGDGQSFGLAGVTAIAPWKDQVLTALGGLGFTGKEASDAVDALAATAVESGAVPEVAVLLRQAIQLLGRSR